MVSRPRCNRKFGFARPHSAFSPASRPALPTRTLIGERRAIKARARALDSQAPGLVEHFSGTWSRGGQRNLHPAACSPSPSSCTFSVLLDDVDVAGRVTGHYVRKAVCGLRGATSLLLLPHRLRIPGSALKPGSSLTWGNLRTPLSSVHGAGSRGFPAQGLTAHTCTWQPGSCELSAE